MGRRVRTSPQCPLDLGGLRQASLHFRVVRGGVARVEKRWGDGHLKPRWRDDDGARRLLTHLLPIFFAGSCPRSSM
jgi:hypothetical protein